MIRARGNNGEYNAKQSNVPGILTGDGVGSCA